MGRDKDQGVEKSVIDKCLRFDEFNCFYQNEWIKRGILIKWKIDPLCNMFAMQSFDSKGSLYITIRKLPESSDDVFLVAHEMGHVIRYFDKEYVEFKKVSTPISQMYKEEEIIDMCAKLGSMLDDPLIDSCLQNKYGFNPANFYKNIIMPDSIEGLKSYGDPPYEWHVFKKALFYSQLGLQFDSINDGNAQQEWNNLKECYIIRRPKVTKIGEELYSLSREMGYNTIEKQRQIFNTIFNKYRINGLRLSEILGTI